MKKYTIDEIDKLRDLCENKYLYGLYRPQQTGGCIPYYEADKIKAVEEMTRTLMLAGIKPEDI